jgi:hypothetical protein
MKCDDLAFNHDNSRAQCYAIFMGFKVHGKTCPKKTKQYTVSPECWNIDDFCEVKG